MPSHILPQHAKSDDQRIRRKTATLEGLTTTAGYAVLASLIQTPAHASSDTLTKCGRSYGSSFSATSAPHRARSATTHLASDVRRRHPETIRRELRNRGFVVVPTVHKHVRRVSHVSHDDELAAGIDNLWLLWVCSEVEVVPSFGGRVRCPVG